MFPTDDELNEMSVYSSTDGPDAATSGPILIQSLLQYLFQGKPFLALERTSH